MKYKYRERVVEAVYGKENGNPYLEALPELLDKSTFEQVIASELKLPCNVKERSKEERRCLLGEIGTWFQPMDYMYTIYDSLYRAIQTSYQTKTVIDSIREINSIYQDFRNGLSHEPSYAMQAYSGAVLGVSGIGKTSSVQRCLSAVPQVIIHKSYQGESFYTKQINYIKVECPSDCSIRTIALNIFAAIDRAISSNYVHEVEYQKAVAISATTTKLKIVCMNHHIGLIVIDEIQNAIATAYRSRQMKPLIRFLVELTNETQTGICFCGVLEAEEIFLQHEHLKRRTRGFRLLPLRYDVTYRRFISSLWRYQTTKHEAKLTEQLSRQLYDLSAGIPAYIVQIFTEAQVQAIMSGKEVLSYESMKAAVRALNIEVPKVYAACGSSISDFYVEEAQPHSKGEHSNIEESRTAIQDDPTNREYKIASNKMEEKSDREQLKSASRFYATKRGRKRTKRDQTDLLVIREGCKEDEELLHSLSLYGMIERRSFSC